MGAQDRFVTIVSGLPRSGTSMMMRMLEAGGIEALIDDIREADIDNPRGYYEYEPGKSTRDDPRWLESASGKVVKMVYSLLYDLADGHQYRVVFMRRDLEEILRSQQKMLDRLGTREESVSDDAMRQLFTAEIDKCRKFLRDDPRFSFLEVDYNKLLSGPGQLVEEVDRFLGGGLDCEAMAAVVDPSLYRNRAQSQPC